MIDLCTLPIGRTFSCPMERTIWLARHHEDQLVVFWWLGFEAAQRGACFDRVVWELDNRMEQV